MSKDTLLIVLNTRYYITILAFIFARKLNDLAILNLNIGNYQLNLFSYTLCYGASCISYMYDHLNISHESNETSQMKRILYYHFFYIFLILPCVLGIFMTALYCPHQISFTFVPNCVFLKLTQGKYLYVKQKLLKAT